MLFIVLFCCCYWSTKAWSFQPRIAIITDTLALALPEVLTFLVVLLVTMVMLSMTAIVILGDQVQEFTTLGSALTFMFKFMVTGDLGQLPVTVTGVGLDREAISELAIWLFYFLMFFLLVCILLNFILAIITRAYLIARTQHSESPTILQDLRGMASAAIRPNRRSELRVMSRFRQAAALPWGGKHASAQVTAIVRGINAQGRLWPQSRLENMLIQAAENWIKNNSNDLPDGAPPPPPPPPAPVPAHGCPTRPPYSMSNDAWRGATVFMLWQLPVRVQHHNLTFREYLHRARTWTSTAAPQHITLPCTAPCSGSRINWWSSSIHTIYGVY